MIENASGIVLRIRPLTETSLIVHWLTAEHGRLATVAKGARRPKSSFAGKLDLLFEADLSFQRSAKSDLHALREVAVRATHAGLRQELLSLNQAAYAVAFVEQMTEVDTPIPEIHELFTGFVRHLAIHPPKPRGVYAYELKLLSLLGLEPAPDSPTHAALLERLIEELLGCSWEELESVRASAAEVRALRQFLHGFITHHCGRLPHGREVALEG